MALPDGGREMRWIIVKAGDETSKLDHVRRMVALLATAVLTGNPVVFGVMTVLTALETVITLFSRKPNKKNDTMREIEAHLERQEQECKRREAEADQRAHGREELARQSEKAANDREALSKRRVDEALAETQKAKEATHEAEEALRKGIRPVVMPTREQFLAAKHRIRYDDEKCHFAVCGASGSGKSSLINAFRGLNAKGTGAANVGAIECTSEVTRYPDPRKEIPFSLFVWYDIPGAGTLNVPDWQYFNDQGLFVFDFIVIVYDSRFTKIDESIIRSCLLSRPKIPFFMVRSKADQHIGNMMRDMEAPECEREVIVEKYVTATKSDFKKNMKKMAEDPALDEGSRKLLLDLPVYIVSGSTLQGLFQATTASEGTRGPFNQSGIIDEVMLIEDTLLQADRRRECSELAT